MSSLPEIRCENVPYNCNNIHIHNSQVYEMPAQKMKMKLCRKNVKADKRGIWGEEGGATRGKRRGRGKMSAFAGFIICPLNPRSFPLVNLLLMLRKAVCGRAHGMRPYNILGMRFRYLRNAGAAFPTIIQANISAIFGTSRAVRVSSGHLCQRQKHRPNRQVRTSPTVVSGYGYKRHGRRNAAPTF